MKQNIELVNEQVQLSHFNRQVIKNLNIGSTTFKKIIKINTNEKKLKKFLIILMNKLIYQTILIKKNRRIATSYDRMRQIFI